MSTHRNRTRRKQTKNRQSTPLGVEQLESRMMNAIDGIQANLELLTSNTLLGSTQVVASPVPTVQSALTLNSGSIVRGRSANASLLGSDNLGESNLRYSWQTTSAPVGGVIQFANNHTNAAKNNTLTFNQAGTYTVAVTIRDRDGLTTSSSLQFQVAEVFTGVQFVSSEGRALGSSGLNTSAQSLSLNAVAVDQFNNRLTSQPTIQWQTLSTPTGGSARIVSTGVNATTTTFTRAGNYTLRIQSGTLNTTLPVTVLPTLANLSMALPNNQTLASGETIQVNGTSQQLTLRPTDQFGQPLTTLPALTWSTLSAPTGGSVSASTAGQSATLSFTKLGTYSLQARSGNVTFAFSATVNPVLTSIRTAVGGRINTTNPITVSGTSLQLTSVGYDQFGNPLTTQPTISWRTQAAVTGATTTLTPNQNALSVSFQRAGNYVLRASSGTVSVDTAVTVAQTLTSLSLNTLQNTAVNPSQSLTVAGSKLELRPIARDQFGQLMAQLPSLTWRTTSAPAGGTLTTETINGVSSVVFRKLGNYTIVMSSGSSSFTFQATVTPVLASIQTVTADNRIVAAGSSLIVSNMNHRLTAIGLDQFGGVLASQPTIAWQTSTAPRGASSQLTPDGNRVDITYNRAGEYVLRASSQSIRSDVAVSVGQTISQLSMKTMAGTSVDPLVAISVAGTSLQLRPVALDQFGQNMTQFPTIAWRATSSPVGGTVTGETTAGISRLTFNKLGDYTLVGRSGNASFTFQVRVVPLFSSIRSLNGTSPISAGIPVTVASSNQRLSAVGLDQFGNVMVEQPTFAWRTMTSPTGSSPTLTSDGNAVAILYRRAGTHTFRVTSGSLTADVPVTVSQTISELRLATTSGTSLDPTQALTVTGTTQSMRVLGFDQFGIAMASMPTTTFRILTAPTGGTLSSTLNGSTTSLQFNKLGTYSLQAKSENATLTFTATVTPTLTSMRVVASGNATGSATTPVTVSGREQSLTVIGLDQFGQTLAQQPNFTWTSQTVPSGASLTLTPNANTARLQFDRAGSYAVRISSGSVATTQSLSVVSTLTSLQLSPGSTTLAARTTQQYQATALDQFGNSMSTRPTLTWSATGGTVSSTGLYTAGGIAGAFAVTVRSGTISATNAVQITAPVPQTQLRNANLSSLVSTLYVDNQISRTEMMQILRSTGTDGVVDSSELTDLQFLVSSSTIYAMPGYVQELARDVVSSNPANRLYRGSSLGNLAAGSSASQLNNLVDKWFLGTDDPLLTNGSYSYRTASGSLFATAPSRADAKQGMLGDCYLIAALVSIADKNPDAVRNLFIDNGDGTYTTRFYAGALGSFSNNGLISSGFLSGQGTADYVTVSRKLPTNANGSLVYSGYGQNANSSSTTLWIALAEKAYAQWNETGNSGRDGTNRYAAIEGGWMANVNAQVLGYNSTNYVFSTASKQSLINALSSNRSVTLGTMSNASAGGLVGGHAYIVTGYNAATDTFSLHNPWGFSHPTPLSWAQLQANCSLFSVTDPTGSQSFASGLVRGSTMEATLGNWTRVASQQEIVNSPVTWQYGKSDSSSLIDQQTSPLAAMNQSEQGTWESGQNLDLAVNQEAAAGSATQVASVTGGLEGLLVDWVLERLYEI